MSVLYPALTTYLATYSFHCDVRVFVLAGGVFLKHHKLVDNRVTFPDIDDFIDYERLVGARLDANCPLTAGPFANQLVSVVAGPLFGDEAEFHLMATANFVMPKVEYTLAYALASGYWERSAQFHGIPFKSEINVLMINRVLDILGKDRRIATTVVSIPDCPGDYPAVVLIGSSPASVPTAINSQGAYPIQGRKTTMDPSYAKWAYYHRPTEEVEWFPVTEAHLGLHSLFAKNPDLVNALEVSSCVRVVGGTLPVLCLRGYIHMLELVPPAVHGLNCTPGGTSTHSVFHLRGHIHIARLVPPGVHPPRTMTIILFFVTLVVIAHLRQGVASSG